MGKHIIFFYADWCGHCERMQEPWRKFVAAHAKDKDMTTEKIESEKIPAKYSGIVNGFPCFAVFVDGKLVKKVEGEQDDLNILLSPPSDSGGRRRSRSRSGLDGRRLTDRVRGRKTLRRRRGKATITGSV